MEIGNLPYKANQRTIMSYTSQNDELAHFNTSYLKKKITGYLNLNQGPMYKRIKQNLFTPT